MRIGAIVLLCVCACRTNQGPMIYVRLDNLPAASSTVRVSAEWSGSAEKSSPREFSIADLGSGPVGQRFSIQLPAGAQGEVRAAIEALDQEGCLIAQGDGRVALQAEGLHRAALWLTPEPAPLCTNLKIEFLGDGNGSVTLSPAGLTCNTNCVLPLAEGSAAQLVASPASGSYFMFWSGGCVGTGTCALTGSRKNRAIRVGFGKGICLPSGWCAIDPLPFQSAITGLWWDGGGSAYALTSHGTFLRWDGRGWLALSTLPFGLWEALWGDSPDRLFALGIRFGEGAKWNPIMAQRTGYSWSLVDVGSGRNGNFWRNSSTEVISVGSKGEINRFDGMRWQPMLSPTGATLESVWGSGPGHAIAVGQSGTVLHLEGGVWRESTNAAIKNIYWRSVFGFSPTEAYIAGDKGAFARFDGTQWITSFVESSVDFSCLFSYKDQLFASSNQDLRRWDGTRWHQTSADHGCGRGTAGLITRSKLETSYDFFQLAQFDGARYQPLYQSSANPSGWPSPIKRHFFATLTDLFYANGAAWSSIRLPNTDMATWGSTWNDIYLAGGVLSHFDGSTLTELHPGQPEESFHGIHGNSPKDIYAVGSAHLWHYDGKGWTPVRDQSFPRMNAVWTTPTDVFVGTHTVGELYHYNGTRWQTTLTGLQYGISAIWGRGATDLWIAGSRPEGTEIQHFDGQKWTVQLTLPWLVSPRWIWGLGNRVFCGTTDGLYQLRGDHWEHTGIAEIPMVFGGEDGVFYAYNGGLFRLDAGN